MMWIVQDGEVLLQTFKIIDMNLYVKSNYWSTFVSFVISGIPSIDWVLFSDADITGYTNINSIVNIHLFIDYIKKVKISEVEYYADYKFCRDRIKDLFTNWNDYTVQEKQIFCIHNIGDKSDRIALIGFENYKLLTSQYGYKATTISRGYRAKFLYSEVWSRLYNEDVAQEIANESSVVFKLYAEEGIDGTISDAVEGLYDYLYGTEGSSWENNGVLQKTLGTIEGFTTNQDFCDFLKDIAFYGKKMDLTMAINMGLLNGY